MKRGPATTLQSALALGGVGVALAAATGFVFAMWMDKGADIFLTLVETGLAWCY